ncbi:hypothetical protein [Roseovarius sp. 2305UL8-3]|uniref:hypothetical protein n=1 Tax=Roseovarius conchicola TaxID=3121636 RepID=UPI003529C52C
MTHVADGSMLPDAAYSGENSNASVIPIIIALLATLVVSAPNVLDPMIRYDDYPAYFADPTEYFSKTKEEGRWLNYWWHLRSFTTPAWLSFTIYQISWALFAAFIALAGVEKTPNRVWFAALLGVLILLSPSATLISLWFNTLLPGLALVAVYAGLGLVVSRFTHRALLVPFTILAFMAYTTYPLLLLISAVVCNRQRSFLDLIGLMSLFVAGFVLAVICVFSLNLYVHGIFGVPVAEWRNATPATDLASVFSNLPLVVESFQTFLNITSFNFTPLIYFHLGFFVMGTIVLVRHSPLEALYLNVALAAGLGLITLQIIKVGVITPPRAFLFAWVLYAIVITRAMQILTAKSGLSGRLIRVGVLFVAGSYILFTFKHYVSYRDWQVETRVLAEKVKTIETPVAITGDILALPSARKAFVQDNRALGFRLQQLTGKTVPVCIGAEGSCCPKNTSAQTDCATLIHLHEQNGEAHLAVGFLD